MKAFLQRMKALLVADAKRAHTWISMWCMGASLALVSVWEYMPDSLRSYLPGSMPKYAAGAALVLGMIGRVTNQQQLTALLARNQQKEEGPCQ